MGNYRIEKTVSAKITLDGLTEETMRRIEEFIRDLLEVSSEAAEEESSGREDLSLGVDQASKECDTAGNKLSESLPVIPQEPEDKWAKVSHYAGYEKIVEVFRDAELHPDNYDWELRIAKMWMSETPNLQGAKLHAVAHTLGSLAKLGLCRKVTRYNPEAGQYEVLFLVPIPKTVDVSTGSTEAASLGTKIRNARKEAGLSLAEFSDLIGYSANIIAGWENGTYTVSQDGMESLGKVFGAEWNQEETA